MSDADTLYSQCIILVFIQCYVGPNFLYFWMAILAIRMGPNFLQFFVWMGMISKLSEAPPNIHFYVVGPPGGPSTALTS